MKSIEKAIGRKHFFKLQIFDLIEFSKIVFLDADMIAVKNIDELFDRDNMTAVSDRQFSGGVKTNINSGLMVVCPQENLSTKLIAHIPKILMENSTIGQPSGDQDVINDYFPKWIDQQNLHLPSAYNAKWNMLDVDKMNIKNIKIIHFDGKCKPWFSLSKPWVKLITIETLKMHWKTLWALYRFYKL